MSGGNPKEMKYRRGGEIGEAKMGGGEKIGSGKKCEKR